MQLTQINNILTPRDFNILSNLEGMLKKHEGLSLKPYRDVVGKLTIGYGRNLDDNGIRESEAESMLQNDMYDALIEAKQVIDNFDTLSILRQVVIVNMIFNLGLNKFLEFKKTIVAINNNNFKTAASEMRNSNWYKQVGQRAEELCELMLKG